MLPNLRVYFGPADDNCSTDAPNPSRKETVTVTLGEVFPLLADAVRSNRTWLQDFEDDEITISSDLYEVMLAYQHYCRPAA